MTSLSLFDLAVLFLPVLLLVLLWGVIRVFLPPRLPRVDEGACARCRYPVRGLGEWRCPECGTDLRVGGILTPALRHRARASLAGGIVSWTLLMIIVGLGTAAVAVPRMVTPVRMQAIESLREIAMMSKSNKYRGLQYSVTTIYSGDGSNPTIKETLLLSPGPSQTIDSTAISATSILNWMKANGVDTSDEQVIGEATDAATIIKLWRDDRPPSTGQFRSLRSGVTQRATGPVRYRYDINPWLWVILGAWIVLSLGGACGMIVLRRRQRTRAGRATGDAATVTAAPPKDAPAATDELS